MDKIVFKCAIGATIGSGHLMRCLTLADEMQRTWKDADIIFLVDEEGVNFPALKNSPYKIVTGDDFNVPCDLLVIDNYALDIEFEKPCRDWAKKILVIDDLADRKHDCDILVDQTYGRSADDYRSLVPDHARLLCGAEYALLRPEFANLRAASLKRRKDLSEIKTILISLGSMNLHNVTSTILDMFLDLKGAYDVKIVLSSHAQYLNEVREKIALIHEQTDHKCSLLCDVMDMAQLMAESDFAIGAGGTTSWERACLGLPSALVEIADNQTRLIKELDRCGAIFNLGHMRDFNAHGAAQNIQKYLSNRELLENISMISSSICEGYGAQKIIDVFSFHLRLATLDDAQNLFDWRNDQDTRMASFNSDLLVWQDHIVWLEKTLKRDDVDLYIAHDLNGVYGTVRCDYLNGRQDIELSWTVAPHARGQGMGKKMLNAIFVLYPMASFIAKIKKANIASEKIAKAVGMLLFNQHNDVLEYRKKSS